MRAARPFHCIHSPFSESVDDRRGDMRRRMSGFSLDRRHQTITFPSFLRNLPVRLMQVLTSKNLQKGVMLLAAMGVTRKPEDFSCLNPSMFVL